MRNTRNIFWSLLVCFIAFFSFTLGISAKADNRYPTVFVHGLTGWGPGELGNNHYWGGTTRDLMTDLNNYSVRANHAKVLEATVSPYGSDWDRACELYAYIKGGTVDYGAAHAKYFGHSRYGRTFKGIYPQWDSSHKIHLVGHSMGGQTIRDLDSLVNKGKPDEGTANHPASPLFTGHHDWISSVSTVATPNNGTGVAQPATNYRFVSRVLAAGDLAGVQIPGVQPVKDYKLDQWGLTRKPGQSLNAFRNQVAKSKIWNTSDNALYDLTFKGAKMINNRTSLSPNEYYFTYSSNATTTGINGRVTPISSVSKVNKVNALILSNYGNNPIWWPNDGEVPVISALHPFGQRAKASNTMLAKDAKGIWNYTPTIQGWDHHDFILQDPDQAASLSDQVYGFYRNMVTELAELPE